MKTKNNYLLEPWKENSVYPGTHWLLYVDNRSHHLVGQIWKQEYYLEYGGPYRWAINWSCQPVDFKSGYCGKLDEAKNNAEQAVCTQWEEINNREVETKLNNYFRSAKQEKLF